MNSRLGNNPQSSGMKRKFPGDGPSDPRFHSGPSRQANMTPFPGRGGPQPHFPQGRGAPFAGRQRPPPGRGINDGFPPREMMRGERGPHPLPTHRGDPGPRSEGRPPMRGANPMMSRGAPGPMQRGPFAPPPPPPMQHHRQQLPPHIGPHANGIGSNGNRPFFPPPPPPPPPPMQHMRHNMPPPSQQQAFPPAHGPRFMHHQPPSGPSQPHHGQNRLSPPPHQYPFAPPSNAHPPPFFTQGVPQQSTMMPTQQQPWNQHTLQQPSSFQGSRQTADELNTQKPAHHRQNLHTAAQQQTSATVVVSSTSHTRDQIDKEWTEHKAPSGMSYYYNSLTKESTFQRPPALATEVPIQAPSAQTQQPTEKVWVEYTDPSTGKKYYSDGQTTSWNKPEGFGAAGTIHHSTLVHSTKAEPEVAETTDSTSVDKKKKRANNSAKRETPFLSKAEATAAFKGMLLAKGIAPNLKWHEVVKLCSSDKRWDDCEDSLTLGERKQALAEYQTKRANELRTMERQERIRAKEAFQQLLTAVLPSSPSFHASTSRFSDIRDVLSKDDRFYAVQDEDIRESLFLDFCEEVRKREDRNRNNKKRECKDAFLAFLREQEEQNILTFASTWSSFISALPKQTSSDSRFVVSPAMSDSDRQVYFADFVIELQAAEDDKRRRIRDARRRAEKAQREAYRDTLRSMAASGILLPSTRWRSVEDIVSTHSTYPPVHDQDREAPRELFEDFIEEWNEVYRRDRALLAGLVHPASNKDILVTGKTTFDEFTRALLQEASYSPEVHADIRHIINHNDPVSSALVYFNELTAKANENSLSVPRARRSSILRTTSEDEGEVVEEGEVTELDALVEAQSVDQPAEPPGGGDENSNPAASNAELTEGQA